MFCRQTLIVVDDGSTEHVNARHLAEGLRGCDALVNGRLGRGETLRVAFTASN